jgi:hypothetical protein
MGYKTVAAKSKYYIKFEMQIVTFWAVTPCSIHLYPEMEAASSSPNIGNYLYGYMVLQSRRSQCKSKYYKLKNVIIIVMTLFCLSSFQTQKLYYSEMENGALIWYWCMRKRTMA